MNNQHPSGSHIALLHPWQHGRIHTLEWFEESLYFRLYNTRVHDVRLVSVERTSITYLGLTFPGNRALPIADTHTQSRLLFQVLTISCSPDSTLIYLAKDMQLEQQKRKKRNRKEKKRNFRLRNPSTPDV